MNPALAYLDHVAAVWGQAMWRATWQGGLVIALVWLVCRLWRNLPARIRCWFWRIAYAKLLVGLLWATPIPLAVLPPGHESPAKTVAVSSVPAPSLPSLSEMTAPAFQAPATPSVPTPSASPPPSRFSWIDLAFGLWSLGVLFMVAATVLQALRVRRLIRSSDPVVDEAIESEVVRQAAELGIFAPEVRLAGDLNSPMVTGVLRPVILLPRAFLSGKSSAELRLMLAHELAHVKRRDLAWAWLPLACRSLFYFHPLVVVARQESRLAEEMAADEMTLVRCGCGPAEYAGLLLEVASRRVHPRREEFALGIFTSTQLLKRRLKAMKSFSSRSRSGMFAAVALTALGGLCAIVPWKLVAQQPLPPPPRRVDLSSWTLPPQPPLELASAPTKTPMEIQVQRDGEYVFDGSAMKLDQIISEIKKSGDVSKESVSVRADSKAPFSKLVALLEKLNAAGVTRISMATESRLSTQPGVFDIAFGVWRPSETKQTGPAAAGNEGDYWNTVGIPWNEDHTESGLKLATGESSPIQVRLVNLGGGWGNSGHMGVKSPMLDSYDYPANNHGGNSEVTLLNIPPGRYDLYLYGHEIDPVGYGDYAVTVGNHSYGRKTTSNKGDAIENTSWVEGSQYVKFAGVDVAAGQNVDILIRPGGQLGQGNSGNVIPPMPPGAATPFFAGQTFSDAVICGLQLVPVR